MNAVCTPTRKAGKCLLCPQPEQSSSSHQAVLRKKGDSLEHRLEIIWGQDHENLLYLLCAAHGWVASEELRRCSQSWEGSATGRMLSWGHLARSPARSQRKEGRSVLPWDTAQGPASRREGLWKVQRRDLELCRAFLPQLWQEAGAAAVPAVSLTVNCWLQLHVEVLGCLSLMGFRDFSMLSKT